MKYIALLRGINVGGNNKIKMAELKKCFEDLGLRNAQTYIQSGNVIFEASKPAKAVAEKVETALPKKFKLDSESVKVFIYSKTKFANIVENAPKAFGKDKDKYYYDFIFLKDITSKKALEEFDINPEVDTIWAGPGVIYFRRLAAKRTKSRMSKIVAKPVYKNMTIRSWNTTNKLLKLVSEL